MITKPAVEKLIRPLIDWIERDGDAWQLTLDYWRARQALMDAGELYGGGPAAKFLSDIDVAMDSIEPSDADRNANLRQTDATQLREELRRPIAGLRGLGYLD